MVDTPRTPVLVEVTPRKKASAKLTEEQQAFYRKLMIRATDPNVGQPYISRALFAMTPVNAPGLKTMGIDEKWRVFIDFDWAMSLKLSEASGIIAHEPWHPLRNHTERGKTLPKPPDNLDKNTLVNIAGDLELNDDIRHLVPSWAIMPEVGSFRKFPLNHTLEQYYTLLLQNPDVAEQFAQKPDPDQGGSPDDGDPSDGNSQGQGEQSDEGNDPAGTGTPDSSSGDPTDENEGNPSKNAETDQGESTNIKCGSGAGNKLDEYELDDEEGTHGLDETDVEAMRTNVAQDIEKYARSNPGKTPGSVSEWASEILAVKPVDWRSALRAEVKNSIAWKRGQVDYVRSRPNRRQPSPGIIYPALLAPTVTIGIAVDTSGSNVHQLGIILEEVHKIMKSVGVRGNQIKAFAVDTQAMDAKPVNDARKLLDGARVHGGTKMAPGYKKLGELGVDIGILFTDGEVSDYPKVKPKSKKPMKFITCVVAPEGDQWDYPVTHTQESVGSWSSVIPLRSITDS